jgi:hypothetical protein
MYIISLVLHRAVCLEAHVNGFKKKKKKVEELPLLVDPVTHAKSLGKVIYRTIRTEILHFYSSPQVGSPHSGDTCSRDPHTSP